MGGGQIAENHRGKINACRRQKNFWAFSGKIGLKSLKLTKSKPKVLIIIDIKKRRATGAKFFYFSFKNHLKIYILIRF